MKKDKQEQQTKEKPALKLPRCEWCGIEFIPTGPKQKYHSDACRQAAFQEAKRKAAR